jgi:hypothetical protein
VILNLAKRAVLQRKPTPTDQVIAQLADVDDDTAHQIRRFLGDVAADHRLVEDLAPESMAELNRALEGKDVRPPISFVSVTHPPHLSLRAFFPAPLQRLFFDVSSRLAAGPPPPPARVPEGPWIDGHSMRLGPGANDGIVPAWSQTLDGRAAGIVLGDHLDVIGHYESVGATFLRSGSHFDDRRFRALWEQVGRCILPA